MLHYAPIEQTLRGEPWAIWPFLGSSRFADVVDRHGASVVFHGHAHLGAMQGLTAGGVPVFNVASPVLQRHGCTHRRWALPVATRAGHSQTEPAFTVGG
jgi:Icc-related predicted phosphoesterase